MKAEVTRLECMLIFPLPLKGKVVRVLFLTEHHAMKTYWGNGGISPLIL
jgi:hypothetical protein